MSPDVSPLSQFVMPPELVRYLTTKAGIRRAFMLLEFVVLWGQVVDSLGGERPTKEQFMAFWGESQATYYRRMDRWHQVWPDDSDPHRVWLWLRERRP